MMASKHRLIVPIKCVKRRPINLCLRTQLAKFTNHGIKQPCQTLLLPFCLFSGVIHISFLNFNRMEEFEEANRQCERLTQKFSDQEERNMVLSERYNGKYLGCGKCLANLIRPFSS